MCVRAWRTSLILGPCNGAGLRRGHGGAAVRSYTVKTKKKILSPDTQRRRQTAGWLAYSIICSHLHPIHEPFTQLIACILPFPTCMDISMHEVARACLMGH